MVSFLVITPPKADQRLATGNLPLSRPSPNTASTALADNNGV